MQAAWELVGSVVEAEVEEAWELVGSAAGEEAAEAAGASSEPPEGLWGCT